MYAPQLLTEDSADKVSNYPDISKRKAWSKEDIRVMEAEFDKFGHFIERMYSEFCRKNKFISEEIRDAISKLHIALDDARVDLTCSVVYKEVTSKSVRILTENYVHFALQLMSWNVDTLSHEGFAETILNKAAPLKIKEMSKEENEKQIIFVKANEKLLKKFGMFQKYDDSKSFLREYPHLACEETVNYLVIWCINLEVEGKHELMEHVAHQCICMHLIIELAKHLDVYPRACISSFFSRIQMADTEYQDRYAFNNELEAFKDHVKDCAWIRIAKAIKEDEELTVDNCKSEKQTAFFEKPWNRLKNWITFNIFLQEMMKRKSD